MAQAKLDIDSLSIEELEKMIEAKKQKQEEEKEKPFFEFKEMIEKKGYSVEQFAEWHKAKFSPIIFKAEYSLNGVKHTFTRHKGQIGLIAKDVKTALRSQGRDQLASCIVKEYSKEGTKVLESIFKDGKK